MDLPDYDRMLAQARAIAVEEAASAARVDPATLLWRNTTLIGGSAALLAIYGSQKWWNKGFGGGFKTETEGWFGQGTEFGGIDKVGHAYSAYFGVRVLAPVLQALGNDPASAARIAAWSTWGAMTAVEVIDGFSKQYKFGREDFVMNTAGALAGYALEAYPELDAAFDLRLAYRRSPHSSAWDPFGDYSGQRYLLVAKAEAVPALRSTPLTRYLEVSVGYGTRGFDAAADAGYPKVRDVHFGVSVNLDRVLADGLHGGRRSTTTAQRIAERTFELVQFPVASYARKQLDP